MNATVRAIKTPAEEAFARTLSSGRSLPGLADVRRDAAAAFNAQGLPHRRLENWKYFDMRGFLREARPLAATPASSAIAMAAALPAPFPGVETVTRGFVDGFRVGSLDAGATPRGVEIRSLGEALERGDRQIEAHLGRLADAHGDGALALSSALTHDGLIIHVDAGEEVLEPVLVDFRAATPTTHIPRLLVILGDGAKLTLIDSRRGPDTIAYHSLGVAEFVLGAGAELFHATLQSESNEALSVSHVFAELGANARYSTFQLEAGSAQSRRQLGIRFNGEGAEIHLAGAALGHGTQVLDTTLRVDHAVPGCNSREIFKYVLGQEARGVFQGKIVVRPDAQQTDGRMSARGLLLNEGAEFNAKPELEIFADDVQCAHGATAGELDEDLLFYLRARGIPEREAKSLLITAFIGEAVEMIAHDTLRDAFAGRIEAWLAANLI